jgi:hypothetical protein
MDLISFPFFVKFRERSYMPWNTRPKETARRRYHQYWYGLHHFARLLILIMEIYLRRDTIL